MNTTTHVLLAQAMFRRRSLPRSGWAATAGGLLPDTFLALFLGVSLVRGVDRQSLWTVEYFNEPWATLGAISNSFLIWSTVTLLAVTATLTANHPRVQGWSKLVAIAGASGLGHVILDFLTHADDAHQHLWPLSSWRFHSPISYWDPAHNANWMMPIEGIIVLTCITLLWRQTSSKLAKSLLVVLSLMAAALIGAGILA